MKSWRIDSGNERKLRVKLEKELEVFKSIDPVSSSVSDEMSFILNPISKKLLK